MVSLELWKHLKPAAPFPPFSVGQGAMICICLLLTGVSWSPYLGLTEEATQPPPKDQASISWS